MSTIVDPKDHPPLFRETAMVQSAHPIITPHRIIDRELGQVVYSPGDTVAEADALKYGLITPEELEARDEARDPDLSTQRVQKAVDKRAGKAGRNRAKQPDQNRAVTPDEDRSPADDAVSSGDRLPGALDQMAAMTPVEDEVVVVDPHEGLPNKSATKAEWVTYAVSTGMTEDEANALTVKDLVTTFYTD